MLFKTFYKSMTAEEKKVFAENLNTSVAYLSQLANGHRVVGHKTVLKIVEATNGEVSPHELRSDIYPQQIMKTA